MQKIIDYLQMLMGDVNIQVKFILAFLHLPVVVFLLMLARQERWWLIRRAHKKALLYVLTEFRTFSLRQYNAAMKYLEQLKEEKNHEPEGHFAGLANADYLNRRWTVLLQNPSVFLYHRYALKPGIKLFALRDKVAFHQESAYDYTAYFSREYKRCSQQYYDNLVHLIQMYEILEENQRTKPVKGNEPEWMPGYMKIFQEWQMNGAVRDIEVCYKQIVVKILQLTRIYRDISFIVRAGEYALKCDIAYGEIVKMKAMLREKLEKFGWCHRLAARMLGAVIRRLDPRALSKPVVAPAWRMTERRLKMLEKDVDKLMLMGSSIGGKRYLRRLVFVILGLGLAGSLAFILLTPHRVKPSVIPVKKEITLQIQAAIDSPLVKAVPTDKAPVTPVVLRDSDTNVYGIDVSKYQGDLMEDICYMDSLHFVICKATEGNTYIDPDFSTNWKLIKQKGLIRGAYHFYRSCDPPLQQAKHFLQAIKDLDSLDLPPVIDVESVDMQCGEDVTGMKNNLLVLLRYIEQKAKRKPVIYTPLDFANSWLSDSAFASYPLWLAEYSGKTSPRLPRAWKKSGYAIWQRMDSYSIDSHKTDFDIFNGTHNDLLAFIRKN